MEEFILTKMDHTWRNMLNLHKWTHSLKSCNAIKKNLCEYIYLTLMTKRLNELIKSYEGFFSSNSEKIKS